MNNMKTNKIYVFEEFFNDTKLMGYLYIDNIKGIEHHSFEFDTEWLEIHKGFKYEIDPELAYIPGCQYPIEKSTFGIFSDICPDRWGRTLLDRRERSQAQKELRKPRKLNESDYLMGVYDETRMGAIRIKEVINGGFLANNKDYSIPPLTSLRTLEEASRALEDDKISFSDKWLNQLIEPGSSLGGAWPKANVIDHEGNLWIAKFPSKKDDYDVGAWEKTAYDLATLCGLKTIESNIKSFSNFGSTFLIKRFDRINNKRVHFASAMTMLNKKDGDDSSSYLDIVDFLKANGASPTEDIKELWKRIVFNMAITNTDDHLRNHGFLLGSKGWSLSPIYDINPVPYGDRLSLNVDDRDNLISLELALDNAPYYGLKINEAKVIMKDMLQKVFNNWESMALHNHIPHKEIEYMRPAFSLCEDYKKI